MRRGVIVVMSGVSVVVAGVSIRGSQRSLLAGAHTAAAPAGIVGASDTTGTAAQAQVATPGAVRATAGPVAKKPAAATQVSPTPTPKTATTTTVNGAPADTQYGPVQVQISIRGGRITRADAIDYPQGSSRDREINSYAIPRLDQETLDAQSANIDTVSGATYTSDGYRQSLQSALDAAHRAGAR